jgi:hypothetical protein
MVSHLLRMPELLWLLWEFRKRWINKGRRKACKEFEKTLKTYSNVIASQGKLNATIIKNFIKWSNKVSIKEVTEFNQEIRKYRKLNKQLEISVRATEILLTRGIFEGQRQKRVSDEMQRVMGRAYSHYDEFKELQIDLGTVKKKNKSRIRKIKSKSKKKKN